MHSLAPDQGNKKRLACRMGNRPCYGFGIRVVFGLDSGMVFGVFPTSPLLGGEVRGILASLGGFGIGQQSVSWRACFSGGARALAGWDCWDGMGWVRLGWVGALTVPLEGWDDTFAWLLGVGLNPEAGYAWPEGLVGGLIENVILRDYLRTSWVPVERNCIGMCCGRESGDPSRRGGGVAGVDGLDLGCLLNGAPGMREHAESWPRTSCSRPPTYSRK